MDLAFQEYQQYIDANLTPDVLRSTLEQLRPKRLFVKDGPGEWQPLRHAGYTLITPTFADDPENFNAYAKLDDIRQLLARTLNPDHYVPAPLAALHQTVARLVSGSEAENQNQEMFQEHFLTQMRETLARLSQFEPVPMAIKGISVLPGGFIAALLTTVAEGEYQRLMSFRKQIYHNQELSKFGVEPQRPFVGHVTLGYLQVPLASTDQKSLYETILAINRLTLMTPVSFRITRVDLRKFNNYLRFFRKNDWPVYRFSKN